MGSIGTILSLYGRENEHDVIEFEIAELFSRARVGNTGHCNHDTPYLMLPPTKLFMGAESRKRGHSALCKNTAGPGHF